MAIEKFSLPGEADFPLNGFFKKPTRSEEDELKKYFTQVQINWNIEILYNIVCKKNMTRIDLS